MQALQAFSAVISIRFSSLPDTDLRTLFQRQRSKSRNPRQRQVTFLLKSRFNHPDPGDIKVSCSGNPVTCASRTELGSHNASIVLLVDWRRRGDAKDTHTVNGTYSSHLNSHQTKLFETEDGVIEWHRFFAQLAFERNAFEVMIALVDTLSEEQSLSDIRNIIQSIIPF